MPLSPSLPPSLLLLLPTVAQPKFTAPPIMVREGLYITASPDARYVGICVQVFKGLHISFLVPASLTPFVHLFLV